ncbi:MAG: hypothetical protein VX667_04650 [Nitrospinota bacterium]|nr:hypothetical protein [Nitrospinota bacterium]
MKTLVTIFGIIVLILIVIIITVILKPEEKPAVRKIQKPRPQPKKKPERKSRFKEPPPPEQLRQDISQLAIEEPKLVVNIVRKWLKEGGRPGDNMIRKKGSPAKNK